MSPSSWRTHPTGTLPHAIFRFLKGRTNCDRSRPLMHAPSPHCDLCTAAALFRLAGMALLGSTSADPRIRKATMSSQIIQAVVKTSYAYSGSVLADVKPLVPTNQL